MNTRNPSLTNLRSGIRFLLDLAIAALIVAAMLAAPVPQAAQAWDASGVQGASVGAPTLDQPADRLLENQAGLEASAAQVESLAADIGARDISAQIVSAPIDWSMPIDDSVAIENSIALDSAQAASLLEGGPPKPFIVATGGSGYDYAYAVAQTEDGGYIVTGKTRSYGAGVDDVLLLKYTAGGTLSWARTAGGAAEDRAYAVAVTSDGGYIVAGETSSYGAGNGDVLLLKYTGNGALSWAKIAGGDNIDIAHAVVQTADGGYILAGRTNSSGAGQADVLLLKYTSNGALSWAKTAGGSGSDFAFSTALTADGGYIVAGYTASFGEGSYDVILLKFAGDGTLSWARTAGGSGSDIANSVASTPDGGYIATGNTDSFGSSGDEVWLLKFAGDGTLSWARTAGGSGDDRAKSVAVPKGGGYIVAGYTDSYGAGDKDVFLLKYADDGALSWARTIGGSDYDGAVWVAGTADGGYVLAGDTSSYGAAHRDYFLIKTNPNGEIPGCGLCAPVSPLAYPVSPTSASQSPTTASPTLATNSPAPSAALIAPEYTLVCGQKSLLTAAGGSAEDSAYAVLRNADGSYVVAGSTASYGAGGDDVWLLKYASDGTLSWARTAGGDGNETAYAVAGVDGGYILAGATTSFGLGGFDILILKFSADGTLSWARTAGNVGADRATALAVAADGGFVVAAGTTSYGVGGYHAMLLKYTADGTLSWAVTAGGSSGNDRANAVALTSDGGYIVAGETSSFGEGNNDVFLLKYASDGALTWARTAGGTTNDVATAVAQTSDGGYILAGRTESYGAGGWDVLLLKYASNGALSWARTAGGAGGERAYAVAATSDGGYAVAGWADGYGAGGWDVLLLKYASNGTLSWARTIGGIFNDAAFSLVQALDGGYILAGDTISYGAGNEDVLVVKTDHLGEIANCPACAPASLTSASPAPATSTPAVTTYSYSVTWTSPTPSSASTSPEYTFVCGLPFDIYLPLAVK